MMTVGRPPGGLHSKKPAPKNEGWMEIKMYYTQALHRAVQQTPDRIAVRFGERKRTFREFADRVARLAGGLQKLGMQMGERVAMLALNSDRYLEYQMAVPWGGGVLNPCNTRWALAEILYSLEDSRTTILLVDEAFRALGESLRVESSTLRQVIYCGDGEVPSGMHGFEALIASTAPIADVVRRGDDLLGIFYTGGTTGFPKGVMLSHGNLCSAGLALHADGLTSAGGIYLHAAPMFHLADMGLAAAQWVAGNTHSVVPSFAPEQVLDTIEVHRVTHVMLVPTMIQMLVDSSAMQTPRDLSSLQTIMYGASPMSETLLDIAMQAFPNVGFLQAYGMTELAPLATILPALYHTAGGRKLKKLRSAGRPGLCVEVQIIDAQGREVPRGVVGEIAVRGPNVMLGYWDKYEATTQVLRNGWMHTGDGGYMDEDGFVFIVDRVKDMIISGGENVYSAEVENVVVQHPAVAACAVIGIPSDEWGETVHAVVVCRPESSVAPEEIIAHCKLKIAGYKCPRSVSFCKALPLSGVGKVLKTELRKPFWEGRNRQVS